MENKELGEYIAMSVLTICLIFVSVRYFYDLIKEKRAKNDTAK